MSLLARDLLMLQRSANSADDAAELSRLEARLPPLLSVIAGMVDFTGFFTLGHIFTAHVTGNIVLAAVVAVDGGSFHWAQLLAIPVFMLTLATVWLIAQASGRHGSSLARLLLRVQFLVLAALLIFSVITRPSADAAGSRAGAAAMIAVSAMACQYALLRLALPGAISTAVMTGNLANAVLSAMDLLAPRPLCCRMIQRRWVARSIVCSASSSAVSPPRRLFQCWETGPGPFRQPCLPSRSRCVSGSDSICIPQPKRGMIDHRPVA